MAFSSINFIIDKCFSFFSNIAKIIYENHMARYSFSIFMYLSCLIKSQYFYLFYKQVDYMIIQLLHSQRNLLRLLPYHLQVFYRHFFLPCHFWQMVNPAKHSFSYADVFLHFCLFLDQKVVQHKTLEYYLRQVQHFLMVNRLPHIWSLYIHMKVKHLLFCFINILEVFWHLFIKITPFVNDKMSKLDFLQKENIYLIQISFSFYFQLFITISYQENLHSIFSFKNRLLSSCFVSLILFRNQNLLPTMKDKLMDLEMLIQVHLCLLSNLKQHSDLVFKIWVHELVIKKLLFSMMMELCLISKIIFLQLSD